MALTSIHGIEPTSLKSFNKVVISSTINNGSKYSLVYNIDILRLIGKHLMYYGASKIQH